MQKIEGKQHCSWQEIERLVKNVAAQVNKSGTRYDCILAITKGGIVPARLLSRETGIDVVQLVPMRDKTVVMSEMPVLDPGKRYLVIDDIYDTGNTYRKVVDALQNVACDFCFCMSRYRSHGITANVLDHNKWIIFPWE